MPILNVINLKNNWNMKKSTTLCSIAAGAFVILIAAAVVNQTILNPARERVTSMAEATERVIEAYTPYRQIAAEYGPYSSESADAAEDAIQTILSASDTETALSYMLATAIAVETGKGNAEGLLSQGFRSLSNAELIQFLVATRRYWDASENERINSAIAIENESRNFIIPSTALLELEPEFRDELSSCLETLHNRVLGKSVNFYLDLYLDRKDCPFYAHNAKGLLKYES